MPKLNLGVIKEHVEVYKHNIPDVEITESSISQSEFPQSSKSHIQKMQMNTDPQNINSF